MVSGRTIHCVLVPHSVHWTVSSSWCSHQAAASGCSRSEEKTPNTGNVYGCGANRRCRRHLPSLVWGVCDPHVRSVQNVKYVPPRPLCMFGDGDFRVSQCGVKRVKNRVHGKNSEHESTKGINSGVVV